MTALANTIKTDKEYPSEGAGRAECVAVLRAAGAQECSSYSISFN
jgi:hypothetical protein